MMWSWLGSSIFIKKVSCDQIDNMTTSVVFKNWEVMSNRLDNINSFGCDNS